jgi:hypothetical protein
MVTFGIATAFAAQLGYVAIAEEPFPAIMMPRFGWAGPSRNSPIEFAVPEIVMTYVDGTSKTLTQRELLARIPTGHHWTIMGHILSPDSTSPTRRAPDGKLEPPAWLFPGYNLARIASARPDQVSVLREWLLGRARDVYGGSPPFSCVVSWYIERHAGDPKDEPPESAVQRSLTKEFRFSFDAASMATN